MRVGSLVRVGSSRSQGVRRTGWWITSATVALVVGACGSGDGRSSAAGESIEGRTFLSTSVIGRDLVPDTQVLITFRDGTLSVQAGCNHLGTAYSLRDGVLVADSDGMSMTEIGCDQLLHQQDEWLAGFFTSSPSVELAGPELTLSSTSDGAAIHLVDREVADPDRPLLGTTWLVDSVISGDAVSSAPDGGRVTLEFFDDSSFRASADGCTSGTGAVEIGEGSLVFAPFAVDGIGCPGPWNETLEVLGAGEATYTIEAARLTIRAGDRGISLAAE